MVNMVFSFCWLNVLSNCVYVHHCDAALWWNCCVSVYQVPYIIAIMQQGVEIRTIEPRLLIQSIDLPKLKLICIGRYGLYELCVVGDL